MVRDEHAKTGCLGSGFLFFVVHDHVTVELKFARRCRTHQAEKFTDQGRTFFGALVPCFFSQGHGLFFLRLCHATTAGDVGR